MAEIRIINGKPNYSEIIDLINAEWTAEFGEASDEEKIAKMDNHHNEKTDTVKYLYENGKIIGFYRYSLWPRDDEKTKQAHTLDISLLPQYQRDNGIEILLSRSFKSNEGSIRLHKKMRFQLHLETDDSFVWKLSL